jgi:dipeptide/tripeptide permease
MDYHIRNVTIPLQIMKSFDPITIIIVLPFIQFFITPFLAQKNRNVPLLKRMGMFAKKVILPGMSTVLFKNLDCLSILGCICATAKVFSSFWPENLTDHVI